MKFTVAALLVLPTAALNPVSKVIQMLGDMKVAGTKALEDEQQTMHDYNNFVLRTGQELEYQVKTGIAKGEELTATIAKAESDENLFGEKIKELDGEIGTLSNEKSAANANRAKGSEAYNKQHQDYEETLYAIDQAITTLQAAGGDRPQAMMMIQKAAKGGNDKMSRGMRRVLAEISLLQAEDGALQVEDGAPAVAAYESQTGGVIEMLTKLKDKFREEKGQLEKEELNATQAHEMVLAHLEETIKTLERQKAAATLSKSAAAKLAAESKGELATTEDKLKDDQALLEELNVTFEAKKATAETNQKVRKEEIEAIGKAIEMLSSPEIQGNYETHVKSLLAEGWPLVKSKTVSLLQMGTARVAASKTAMELLKTRASALKSANLFQLVTKASDSPFAKVITMVEDLLAKLQEEASSEADHKAFCDEELHNNKIERDELTATAARLRAEADEAAAKVKEMAGEIAALSAQQADLAVAMKEATEVRVAEKEANLIAIKDAKQSQTALAQATAVLQEFYAKQAFVQLKQKQVPEMAAYSGMKGESGGVMGMLEVIQSDFARLESDTSAAEDQAASEYDTFMSDSEADKKAKHDAEFKTSLAMDQTDFEREQAEKDFAATTDQLEKANGYYQELKPQCIDVNVSFEERAKMRQEEIKALNEAYEMLAAKGGE